MVRAAGKKYAHFMLLHVMAAILLNVIVVVCNDRIARAADGLLGSSDILSGSVQASAVWSKTGLSLMQFVLLLIAGTLAAGVSNWSGNQYSALVQRRIRGQLTEHLLALPFSYYDEQGTGSIMTKLSSDMGEAGRFFSEILPQFLVNLIIVLTTTVYFVKLDGRLLLVLLFTYPVMLIVSDRMTSTTG